MSDAADDPGLTDPLADVIGYQLRRASALAMSDLSAALSAENISPIAASVLLMIEANPDQTQTRIGAALAIQRANMAPLVARLEEDGLVRRKTPDGRSYGLVCTARGAEKAAAVRRIMNELEDRLFGDMSDTMRRHFINALRAVREKG